MQHRTTIASDDAWAVVMAPLASERVLPLQAALLGVYAPQLRREGTGRAWH